MISNLSNVTEELYKQKQHILEEIEVHQLGARLSVIDLDTSTCFPLLILFHSNHVLYLV